MDSKSKPWRRYHACQALLINSDCVPPASREEVWHAIADVVEMGLPDKMNSDDAQIWRLESDLAALYLQSLDLGAYDVAEQRPLTIAWWAARSVTELMTAGLPEEGMSAQIREWREQTIDPGTVVTRDAWSWLCPKPYSPARFATLNAPSPRSVALLISLGDYARFHGLGEIPDPVMARLRDDFCRLLLVADVGHVAQRDQIWIWDRSLMEAADAYLTALPSTVQTPEAAQALAFVKELGESEPLERSLDQLVTSSDSDAMLICNRASLYCYEHADAADILLKRLRRAEWRDACAGKLHMVAWRELANGLLVLQTRQGIDLAAELPYIFLKLAEATAKNTDRSALFLACLVSSSLMGQTAGALKSLGESKQWPMLRSTVSRVFQRIEELRSACSPGVAMSLWPVSALLERCLGGSL